LANQANIKISTASASTATPLSISQGSVTGTVAFPALQVKTTWNNASLVGQGIVFSLTDTSHAAGSKLLNLYGGSGGTTTLFSVDTGGNSLQAGTWRTSGAPATGGGGVQPLVSINANGSTGATYSTSGTQFAINSATGFVGNMLDFHVNGAASVANMDYLGNWTLTNPVAATSSVSQSSPIITLLGNGWNTGGSASELETWTIQNVGINASDGSKLTFSHTSADGAGGTVLFPASSVSVGGSVTVDSSNSNYLDQVSFGTAYQSIINRGTNGNTMLQGTITVTNPATTGTVTFASPASGQGYTNAPRCQLTPTTDPNAVAGYWATATATVLTANVHTTPGSSITFNYACFGAGQ